MKASAIEKCERETVVRMCEGEETSVFTASLSMYRKLKRLGYVITMDTNHYAWFDAPAKTITFRRNVDRPKRALTAEQREAMSERMRVMRKKDLRSPSE